MRELKQSLRDLGIDETWTLFLDRDGVINQKIESDYVRDWSQFQFLPSAAEAVARLSSIFGRLIVITNQRGVARHLILDADLMQIHEKMIESIRKKGGQIDGVYVCPHDVHARCGCRKPKTGLALEAKKDFPSIVFSRSVMVGDDSSDIAFSKALNMKSVLIKADSKVGSQEKVKADFTFRDLYEFASSLSLEKTALPWIKRQEDQ